MGSSASKLSAGYASKLAADASKLAADASKTAAEAEAVRQRAAADVSKIAAEAEAIRQRAAADASKTAADASKTAAETEVFKTKARSARTTVRLRWARGLGIAAGAAWLTYDFITHEYDPYIAWSMKRHLRACPVPASAADLAPPLLPVPGPPLQLGKLNCPTLLLGPTGSGKSSQLAELARSITHPADKAQKPAPVVLIRFRLPEEKQLPTSNTITTSAPADPAASMQKVAARVYQQIGFPARDSLVGWALRQPWSLWGTAVPAILPSSSRLMCAFDMLFRVCDELFHERVRGGMAVDVAKVKLLLDEMQDLIKDERLATVGGRAVFVHLATLLVAYCVDGQAVAAAVTGSSAVLGIELGKTVAGGRLSIHQLPDPTEETVTAELVKEGFTSTDAGRIINACGRRLRLLETPLKLGRAGTAVDAFLDASLCNTAGDFYSLLAGVPAADASALLLLLDRLLVGETVSYYHLPQSVRVHALFSKVLYVQLDRSLVFQSLLCQRVWEDKQLVLKLFAGKQAAGAAMGAPAVP